MNKTKGLKISIIALIIVLTISAFSLLLVNLYVINKKDEASKTDAYFVITSGLSKQEYEQYTYFEINSASGLEAMGALSLSLWEYYDNLFQDKTIYLTTNISVSKAHIFKFAGTFDGQGYTISITDGTAGGGLAGSGGVAPETSGNIGLFCGILTSSGRIKNTNFKDCYAYCNSGGAFADSFAGIIVGENNGIVENCIVENCEFRSNRYRTNCYVAPIVGKNNGTVKNCMVRGNYIVGGEGTNFMSNPDGAMSYFFTASGNNANNSIYCASWDEGGSSDCYDYVYSPNNSETDGGSVDARGAYNYSSCASAYSLMHLHGSYSSQISTSCGSSGTAWFKYSSSSQGYGGSSTYCVYLRRFISWSTVSFSAGTGGTVSPSSVTVPSNYTSISYSGNVATIYDTGVVATANAGYEFSSWSERAKKANFSKISLEISFADVSNCSESSSTVTLGSSYYIPYGNSISLTYAKNANNTIKSIKFSFTDSSGTSRTITYAASSGYYITKNNLTTSTSYSVTSAKTGINVAVAKKSYNITFG